jgi:hypothetical protein
LEGLPVWKLLENEDVMKTEKAQIVAERDGVVLRHATADDLSRLDEIIIVCYEPSPPASSTS